MPIDEELARNYDTLRKQRGWSWETLAKTFGDDAKELAAWARSKAHADDEKSKTEDEPDKPKEGPKSTPPVAATAPPKVTAVQGKSTSST